MHLQIVLQVEWSVQGSEIVYIRDKFYFRTLYKSILQNLGLVHGGGTQIARILLAKSISRYGFEELNY